MTATLRDTKTDSASQGQTVAWEAPPPKPRRWPWMVAGAVLLAFGVRYIAARNAAAVKRPTSRPIPVVVVPARKGDLPVYLRGIGSVIALKTATIKSRVDGQLVSVAFAEGQDVQEGQVLCQIDPRPFEVQLEQAQGQLARDQAALRDAQINYERYKDLFDQQIIPKQQLDSQGAVVDQFRGALKADQGQIDNAKLQLTYAQIVAPFSGRVGLRLVDPGNIVHASDANGLLVLAQLHPIAVVFSLPQDDLNQVLAKLKSKDPMAVEAYDRDNTKKIADGKLLSIDNQIDSTTGTYKLKGVFDNKDDALFPNQFVNVRLLIDTRRNLVIVPTPAIQKGPQGSFVFVVKDGQGKEGPKAIVRAVTVAFTEGQDAGVTSGIDPADSVVVDGQDKLQDGTLVDLGTKKDAGAPSAPR